jgi:hypothetical protein
MGRGWIGEDPTSSSPRADPKSEDFTGEDFTNALLYTLAAVGTCIFISVIIYSFYLTCLAGHAVELISILCAIATTYATSLTVARRQRLKEK